MGWGLYDGIVGFQFTIANYVDTIDHVYLMGSYDGEEMVFVDSTDSRTDGNYMLFDAPPKYYQYFLFAKCLTGDTATIKNTTQFAKKRQVK
jgi:hypothetical protein